MNELRIEYAGNHTWHLHWNKINGIIVFKSKQDAIITENKIREGLL